jgi:biofilm PGA synthesis N-glycosyltransferase PgaC
MLIPPPDTLLKMVDIEEDEKEPLRSKTVNFMDKLGRWGRKVLDYIDSVYVTNGPFSVYRKKFVQQVGGFDPKNMTEDIEITWNLLSKGYKTKMSYSTTVYTIVPSEIKQWIKQRVRWNVGGIKQ